MRIGSCGYPGKTSWHTSCFHIPQIQKPACASSGATVAGTGGRGGTTGESGAAAATERGSPPPCLTACGAAHSATGVLLPGAVASAAAVISRRRGYRLHIPGEPLWWGGRGSYLQHDLSGGTWGTRMSDHVVSDEALRHPRNAGSATTRYHLTRWCGTGVSARTNYS